MEAASSGNSLSDLFFSVFLQLPPYWKYSDANIIP
jgi:hypothetical protein